MGHQAPVSQSRFKLSYRLEGCNFVKKETPAQVFSQHFCKIFKNTYFVEYMRTVASENPYASLKPN